MQHSSVCVLLQSGLAVECWPVGSTGTVPAMMGVRSKLTPDELPWL